MTDVSALTHTGICEISPYQPGKPTEELERELGITGAIKLASNENPMGPSPKVKEALAGLLDDVALYPDANGFYLKNKLVKYWGIKSEQITLGNGSNDVLDIIARVFAGKGDEVVFSQYGFLVYLLCAKVVNAKPVQVPAKDFGPDLNQMLSAITDKTKLIFIANPNNPTGTYIKPAEVRAFLDQVPDNVIVVMDEAYQEYIESEEFRSTIDWLDAYPNLIVTKTFSKAYGLAGLRIGYAAASAEITDLLNRVRQPFNANLFALKAAEVAFEDRAYLSDVVALNNKERELMAQTLDKMGYACIPSQGNFICFDLGENAGRCNQFLLEQGVIVRPVANYQMPNHLRVTVGLPEENQRFIKAMEQYRCQ